MMPLKNMLMPTSVPTTHSALEGQVSPDHCSEEERDDAIDQ